MRDVNFRSSWPSAALTRGSYFRNETVNRTIRNSQCTDFSGFPVQRDELADVGL